MYLIQNIKRHEICSFFENLKKLELNQNDKKFLKRKILRYSSILISYIILTFFYVIYAIFLNYSNYSMVIFTLSTYVQISAMIIHLIFKSVEELLVIKLENFLKNLELSKFKINDQINEFERILLIFEDFHHAFGLQMTLNMTYFSGMLSLTVSAI
jgi:hypothetical protein